MGWVCSKNKGVTSKLHEQQQAASLEIPSALGAVRLWMRAIAPSPSTNRPASSTILTQHNKAWQDRSLFAWAQVDWRMSGCRLISARWFKNDKMQTTTLTPPWLPSCLLQEFNYVYKRILVLWGSWFCEALSASCFLFLTEASYTHPFWDIPTAFFTFSLMLSLRAYSKQTFSFSIHFSLLLTSVSCFL